MFNIEKTGKLDDFFILHKQMDQIEHTLAEIVSTWMIYNFSI